MVAVICIRSGCLDTFELFQTLQAARRRAKAIAKENGMTKANCDTFTPDYYGDDEYDVMVREPDN